MSAFFYQSPLRSLCYYVHYREKERIRHLLTTDEERENDIGNYSYANYHSFVLYADFVILHVRFVN